MILPSHLPEGVSLPMVIGGALVVAGVIRLFSRKPTPPRAPAQSSLPPRSPLEPIILQARTALATTLSARAGVSIRSTHYGAVEIAPVNLAVWLIVDTDRDRDRIKALADFDATCRAALTTAGYPAGAVPSVHFGVESEETVQRDWGGNWWHYFK